MVDNDGDGDGDGCNDIEDDDDFYDGDEDERWVCQWSIPSQWPRAPLLRQLSYVSSVMDWGIIIIIIILAVAIIIIIMTLCPDSFHMSDELISEWY